MIKCNCKEIMTTMLFMVTLLSVVLCSVNGIFYDSFYGTPLTEEEVKRHDKANSTFWCVNDIEPCDPNEGRRIDGSCNNLKHPTRGASHTPFYRFLPAAYDKDFEPRKSKSGEDLPLSRYLRTNLLSEGRVPSQMFTHLLTHYMIFMAADVSGPHDTVNYVHWKTHCCTPKGKTDPMCAPNKIPDDDPVHRFSDIRCMNMTKPITFQSAGCIKNDTTPERLDTATPLLDLSTLYGTSKEAFNKKGRKFEKGLLKFEIENGKIWPPSTKTRHDVCYGNAKPFETRCHAIPDDTVNALLGINLLAIWFWRHHNLIATEIENINPCWDDEKLFNTARDINIAFSLQIFYYELLPTLLGGENLLRDGVISSNKKFRDIYDESFIPQLSLEYPFVLRWMHTIQEGIIKMYDSQGNYMKKIPVANLTLRTGYLPIDNNIDYITQGSFRQGSAKVDYIVDPDVSEAALGPFQKALDIPTNDMAKNRYFGFQPYIKYREYCSRKPYKTFDDLIDVIDAERIEKLKEVYQDIEDMDLLAGIWMEHKVEGGYVPPTLYCLVAKHLIHNIMSDRHWYERRNRPNAFTLPQLLEIRKATIARLLCDVGDSVSRIQRNAFLRAGPENLMADCEEFGEVDFWAWEDNSCYVDDFERNRRKDRRL